MKIVLLTLALLIGLTPLISMSQDRVRIAFSEETAECDNTLVTLKLGQSLNPYTKNSHRKASNYEQGITPPTISNYCKKYFDPLMKRALENDGYLEAQLLKHSSTDQCCRIVGGSVYAPRLSCWDVPAETVKITFINGLTLNSRVKNQECPFTKTCSAEGETCWNTTCCSGLVCTGGEWTRSCQKLKSCLSDSECKSWERCFAVGGGNQKYCIP